MGAPARLRRQVLSDDVAGAIVGAIGVLARDGERVRCHFRGGWFRSLGGHIGPAHRLTADEYRELVGLRSTTGRVYERRSPYGWSGQPLVHLA